MQHHVNAVSTQVHTVYAEHSEDQPEGVGSATAAHPTQNYTRNTLIPDTSRETHMGTSFAPARAAPPQMHTASNRQAQADRARVHRSPNGNEDGIPSLPDANPHQEHANARLPTRHTHGHEYDPDARGPH